jgi:hypothetical protein
MTEFTAAELALLEDMIQRRSLDFAKPPWMQSHRATALKRAAGDTIGRLPKASRSGRSTDYHTDHDRVVVHLPTTGLPGKTHEADVDRLPVCIMRGFFERVLLDPAERDLVTHLGPGTVTCGHCANARRS